jgi:hypothetical protein
MKTKIENWFKGDQNYQQGVALLIEAGFTKGKVLKNLQRGESKTNKEKLAWELCEIVKLDRSIITQVNTKVPDNRVSTAAGKRIGVTGKGPNEPIEPPIITAIKTKLAEFTKLRGQMHSEMAALGKSNESSIIQKRQELIEKIDEINAEYDRLYEEKEKFFREKILPAANVLEKPQPAAPKGNAELSPVELMRRQNSLRSQISKAKDKLKKASKADKKEAQEKLDKLTSELDEIEKLLSK